MGTSCDFDTEHFIFEVQSRPAIWDVQDQCYSVREVRRQCWEELATIFLVKQENPSETNLNELVRTLQRKWKSLRDCYTRERLRLSQNRGGPPRKSAYLFYNSLSFLQKVTRSRDTTVKVVNYPAGDEAHVVTDMQQQQLHSTGSDTESRDTQTLKRSRADSASPEVQCLLDVAPTDTRVPDYFSQPADEDGDRLFLLSLLGPLKEVPQQLQLNVRIELMKVIQSAMNQQQR